MKIHAANRLYSAKRVTPADIEAVYKSKGFAKLRSCVEELKAGHDIADVKVVGAILTNLKMWFEGYAQHPLNVQWDEQSVAFMTHHLRTIQKYYPSKPAKHAFRVTEVDNTKGLSSADLIGRAVTIKEPRVILSFSQDPNYPATFWRRVRSSWAKEMKLNRKLLPEGDYAAVVYSIPVTTRNLLCTYDSCVAFIEAVRDYFIGFLYELSLKYGSSVKYMPGSVKIAGVTNILRPFIQRQREVIIRLPKPVIKAEVIDVVFNTADLRKKR